MKKIKLTQGKFAVVDDDDFAVLNQHNWYYTPIGYAARNIPGGKYRTILYMHKVISGNLGKSITDHINMNKLDNRKSNLRVATTTQNVLNRGLQKNNTSGCKGVSWHKKLKLWRVRVKLNGVEKSCGYFKDLESAIKRRKESELIYYSI